MTIKQININIYKVFIVAAFSFLSFSTANQKFVYSLQDYFTHGQSLVDAYLESSEHGEHVKQLLNKLPDSCVQIEVPHSSGEKTLVSMGGAVIVGKGMLLLSSGHNFVGLDQQTPIKVFGPDGTTKKAYVIKMDYSPKNNTDWAILQIEGAGFHPKYAVELSRSIKAKEMAIILGYPQSYGKDKYGQVMHTRAYPNQRLKPLVLITRTSHKESGKKVVLDLESGAYFLPGASGGPAFNAQGELMGQYTSFITVVGRGKTKGKASMRAFPKALVKMLNP